MEARNESSGDSHHSHHGRSLSACPNGIGRCRAICLARLHRLSRVGATTWASQLPADSAVHAAAAARGDHRRPAADSDRHTFHRRAYEPIRNRPARRRPCCSDRTAHDTVVGRSRRSCGDSRADAVRTSTDFHSGSHRPIGAVHTRQFPAVPGACESRNHSGSDAARCGSGNLITVALARVPLATV